MNNIKGLAWMNYKKPLRRCTCLIKFTSINRVNASLYSIFFIGMIGLLTSCAHPVAPKNNFSMLPDNAFSDAVEKYAPLVGITQPGIDVEGIAYDFIQHFRGRKLSFIRQYFIKNGGKCSTQSSPTIRCWVRIEWTRDGGRSARCISLNDNKYHPPPCEASVGLLYRFDFENSQLNAAVVRVKNVEPTNKTIN